LVPAGFGGAGCWAQIVDAVSDSAAVPNNAAHEPARRFTDVPREWSPSNSLTFKNTSEYLLDCQWMCGIFALTGVYFLNHT
jgi:hypothetical protein